MSLYLALCASQPVYNMAFIVTEQSTVEQLEKDLEAKHALVRDVHKTTLPLGIKTEANQGVHQDMEEEGEDPEEDTSNGQEGDQT